MFAGMNAAHMGQSGYKANGSMTAHAEITHVVEENDPGGTGRIGRFEEGCADNDI
jgi:hypothetical protein